MSNHDLDIKTRSSYGSSYPEKIIETLKLKGVSLIAFSDLFSVEQNFFAPSSHFLHPSGVKLVTGSEWYTKCDIEGVERVDLLFIGFRQTPKLEAWVRRENKRIELKKKALPKDIDYADSWRCKNAFGQMIADQNLRRSYFGTLPIMEQVIDSFRRVGGKVFLSGVPFTKEFSVQCRLVKYLKGLGLEGAVVFKDENQYEDTEAEISRMLDLCKYADIMPIVGSGVCSNYESRIVAMESVATEAFGFLTKQLVEKLDI